jgi:hypothetical protein
MRMNKHFWFLAGWALTASFAMPSNAQQSLVHIISPPAGLVVRAGQTVAISVAADPSVQKLAVIGQRPLGMARLAVGGAIGIVAESQGKTPGEETPLQFVLTIPVATQPGIYRVTAVGRTGAGPVESDGLALDVERAEEPARIWAEPSILQFARVGDRIPLRVLGSFADGSQVELTRSSKTRFTSADSGIASITSDGLVTAVAEGKTAILVRTPSADYSIPVRVQEAH